MARECLRCSKEITGYQYITCIKCDHQWHVQCAHLTGITPASLEKLAGWTCPPCIMGEMDKSGYLKLVLEKLEQQDKWMKQMSTRMDKMESGGRETQTAQAAALASSQSSPSSTDGGGNSSYSKHSDGPTTLHPHDQMRRDKLSEALMRSANAISSSVTVLLFDSTANGIKDAHLDRGRKTHIIAVGGTCIVAAVHSLEQHRSVYPNVLKVGCHLGTNDALHADQHCAEERETYLASLERELHRVFPSAKITFMLPMRGLNHHKLSDEYIDGLHEALINTADHMEIVKSPNISGKTKPDGVHPDEAGRNELTKFLQKRFVPRKLQPRPRKPKPQGGYSVNYNPSYQSESVRTDQRYGGRKHNQQAYQHPPLSQLQQQSYNRGAKPWSQPMTNQPDDNLTDAVFEFIQHIRSIPTGDRRTPGGGPYTRDNY